MLRPNARLCARGGSVFALLLLLSVLLADALPSSATPVRDPKRVVYGRVADLTPLLTWWTNRHGARPLTAWVHVTGTVIQTNAWGWVVQAQVEASAKSDDDSGTGSALKSGAQKVLLRNPPVTERAEFDSLSAQLKELESERSSAAGAAGDAKSRAAALKKERQAYRRSRVLAAENRQVNSARQEADAELKPLDQQIHDLKVRLALYPNLDHYEVDCFALDNRAQFQGMAVLDHGAVWR